MKATPKITLTLSHGWSCELDIHSADTLLSGPNQVILERPSGPLILQAATFSPFAGIFHGEDVRDLPQMNGTLIGPPRDKSILAPLRKRPQSALIRQALPVIQAAIQEVLNTGKSIDLTQDRETAERADQCLAESLPHLRQLEEDLVKPLSFGWGSNSVTVNQNRTARAIVALRRSGYANLNGTTPLLKTLQQ